METTEERIFLSESNLIEGVTDSQSLEQAAQAWNFLIMGKTLTVLRVLEAHGILMRDHLPESLLGKFREEPVLINGKLGYPWYAIPDVMAGLTRTMNLKQHSEEAIRQHHVKFEKIHPFIDGNGRIGRMLYNWERIRNGLPIHIIYNKDKEDYYQWFDNTYEPHRDKKRFFKNYTELKV